MATSALILTIVAAIKQANPEEQRDLLAQLPYLLDIERDDFALLKLAEQSFSFWDNPDDSIYDDL